MHKQYTSKRANNSDFWSDHWNKQDIYQQMLSAKKSELIPLFKKYLPREGKILEAGCGQGIFVNALKDIGCNIEGIDFDKQTVEKINKNFPKLNINIGDVFDLKFPNNYFSGYISLGVIEHYENNWKFPINEAKRVLSDNGVIFLSVPYFNYSRQLLNFFKFFFHKTEGEFYQYFFKIDEICRAVESCGFKLVDINFYGKSKTLMGLPLLGRLFRKQYDKLKSTDNKLNNDLKTSNKPNESIRRFIFKALSNKWFAHMIVVIGKK